MGNFKDRRKLEMQLGIVLVVVLSLVSQVHGIHPQNELSVSQKELTALMKFRQLVGPYLKEDYMKKDLYLLRWLRAVDLDLKKAQTRFMENLEWRAENRIDDVLNDDWSDVETDYPYTTDTHDKEGRPIVAFSLGDWDLRKGILQGKRERIIRYLDKGFEDVTVQIREKNKQGSNVTQAIFLIDIKNFNLIQQGCLQCLPTIYQYFQHQIFYPNLPNKIILIDTPGLFEAVLQLLGPIMAPETRLALKVFNPDKAKSRNYLYSIIDKDQLYPEFGGTRSH